MISVVLSCLDLAWSNTISWRGWKNNFSSWLVAIKKIFCTAELKFNKTLSYYYSEKVERPERTGTQPWTGAAAALTGSPAGQKRCSGPSYIARFLATGMLSSFRVRWAGWSPSWLVPLSATDDSRSKLILPSGLGYSMGVQSLAGFSWCASRPGGEQCTAGYERFIFSGPR